MNPLAGIGLITGALLNVAWGTAVSLSDLVMKKGKAPTWLPNLSTRRIVTPAFYISSIVTIGLFAAVPLSAGSITGTIYAALVLFITCLLTFSRPYREVRTTAEGRALYVVIFSALIIVFLPVALLIAYFALGL